MKRYLYEFDVRSRAALTGTTAIPASRNRPACTGAIVIDPLEPEPFTYDRDYVVLLSDWTDLDPTYLFARLKKMSDYDNFAKLTVGDFDR